MGQEKVWLKLYKRYTTITKYLVEICDIARGAMPTLSTQNCLRDFDRILQAILFYQSKLNKTLYPKEVEFLSGLAGEADILLLVKKKLASEGVDVSDISWQNVYNLEPQLFERIENVIKEFTDEYTKDLSVNIALAEYISGKNYYDKISDTMIDLLCQFSRLESGIDDMEIQQGILAYCELVAESYIATKENMDEVFAGNEKIEADILNALRAEFKENKKKDILMIVEGKLKDIKQKIQDFFSKSDK